MAKDEAEGACAVGLNWRVADVQLQACSTGFVLRPRLVGALKVVLVGGEVATASSCVMCSVNASNYVSHV